MKNISRGRASKDPEKVHATAVLVKAKLTLFQAQHGLVPTENLEVYGKMAEEASDQVHKVAPQEEVQLPASLDDTSGTVGLQGSGKPPSSEQFAIIIDGMRKLISEQVISVGRGAWRPSHLADLEALDIWCHKYAIIGDTRTITSTSYGLEQTRDSTSN